jgi:hypothetical protein
VIFGQAGTRYQCQMIANMKAAKEQWTDSSTGNVQYDDSEDWLYKTFNRFRTSECIKAHKKSGELLSRGSLLVAFIATPGSVNGLASYDFSTGIRTQLPGNVAADGTDAIEFLKIAKKHLNAMTASSNGLLSLDEWARNCLLEAMTLHPTAVGWPADLLIAKPDGREGRWIVQSRIDASSPGNDPMFQA